jgi:hypothetical protein
MNWIAFRYWWFVWLLFIIAVLLFIFKGCKEKEVSSCRDNYNFINQFNKIDSLLYNCCDCGSGIIEEKEIEEDSVYTDPPGTIPCNSRTESGGEGVTRNNHDLGENPGLTTISYIMYSVPDKLEVIYEGNIVASTNLFVSGTGSLTFNYQPNHDTFCTVIVTGKSGTDWKYTMECPR